MPTMSATSCSAGGRGGFKNTQCPGRTLRDSDLIDLGQVQALVFFKSSPKTLKSH